MFKTKAIKFASCLILIILALIPFQGFLPVYLNSIVGHYTLLRLWAEFLLVVILIIAGYIFFSDSKVRKQIYNSKLIWFIKAFLVVQLIWGIVAYFNHDLSKKALAYGLLLDCRYLIFFVVVWIIALKNKTLLKKVPKTIIYSALVVVGFGLLQIFVLPHNFLSHFGYGPKTIMPYQTINSNSKYVRILSTLRGSNPLGAYLIIPLTMLSAYFLQKKGKLKSALMIVLTLTVLVFSFSRSAWIGALVAMLIVCFYSIRSKKIRTNLTFLLIAVLIIGSLGVYALRNNHKVQNLIFHTQSHSSAKISSDQAHESAVIIGIKEVLKDPVGKGPGSAGPASVYNNHPARIAEDYYVQIAQESGFIGLALYLIIIGLIGYHFWRERHNTLGLILFASLVGISLVNVFLFAWSDDTLSYLWWGLAGIGYGALETNSALESNSKQ
jgi:hypothetical protein